PEVAARVESDAKLVAVTVGPDRWVEAFVRQRIARRRRAVVSQAKHLAQRGFRILRGVELLTFAVGEEEMSVGRERDAAGEVAVAIHVRHGPEQRLDLLQSRLCTVLEHA